MRSLVYLLVAAIAARLVMALITQPLAHLGGGDDAFYLATARGLAHGCYCLNGIPTTYRPPGYSMFLAALGASPLVAVIAQMALTIGSAVLVWRMLAKDNEPAAWLAALLVATSPFLIVYELTIISEILYGCLVLAAWLLLYRTRQWRPAIAAGVLLGLAILTRDTLLLLPAFFVTVALFKREWLRRALIAAAVAYAIALPWQFHVHDSRAGYALWIGTWEVGPHWQDKGIGDFRTYPARAFADEAERSRLARSFAVGDDRPFRAAALKRIRDHPFATAAIWAERYWRLWIGTRLDQIELRPRRGSLVWTLIKSAGFGLNLLTLALGLAGMWLARKTRLMLFAVPVAYVALVYIPFHNTEPRYSLIALPFLYIFAVAGHGAICPIKPALVTKMRP